MSGIPQGSVLGPLLFVIYINDLVDNCSAGSDLYLYSDDAKLFKHILHVADCTTLQVDIVIVNSNSKEFKVHSAEHCSHCTKKLNLGKRKRKQNVFSLDLNVDSVLDDMTSDGRDM